MVYEKRKRRKRGRGGKNNKERILKKKKRMKQMERRTFDKDNEIYFVSYIYTAYCTMYSFTLYNVQNKPESHISHK